MERLYYTFALCSQKAARKRPNEGAIMSFAIITDSTSDISPARTQELGIYVIPLHVIIEGEDLLDQVQASSCRCSIFA